MSSFLKGLQDRVTLARVAEAVEMADDGQLIELAIEVHRQRICRNAISQNIINQRDDGLSFSSQLELRAFPLKVKAMTTEEAQREILRQYEKMLGESRSFEKLIASTLRIETEEE